ncbi:hypothetical protein [Parerythrobacter aestuarii]|uniref:hypothetical protein n=1 Tax=Parerythrobacter aestuarii TaxID=3020909 RepID=UPI0024DE7AA9|nr:hypothetical protein [Parerythrobacter aestuarii]
MMWVLFGLSIIEIGVVHLLVALSWPWIGWPLSIVSILGAIWLVFFIRSLRRTPHLAETDRLLLRLGTLKTVEVAYAQISCWTGSWESGAHKSKGSLNLAAIAYPNRAIHLKVPLKGGKNRVFVRFDAPDDFDQLMSQHGILHCGD